MGFSLRPLRRISLRSLRSKASRRFLRMFSAIKISPRSSAGVLGALCVQKLLIARSSQLGARNPYSLRLDDLPQQIRLRLVAHQVRMLLTFVVVELERLVIIRVFDEKFDRF